MGQSVKHHDSLEDFSLRNLKESYCKFMFHELKYQAYMKTRVLLISAVWLHENQLPPLWE